MIRSLSRREIRVLDDGREINGNVWYEPDVLMMGSRSAQIFFRNKSMGFVHLRNGYWVAPTGTGPRYYSNVLAAAYAMVMVQEITPEEAATVQGPTEPKRNRPKPQPALQAA